MTTLDSTPARMAGPCSNCIALRDELTDTRTQADLAIETMNELFAERETLTCDLAAARAALALLADARSLAVVEAAFAEALRGQDILEAAHDLTGKRMMAAERERDDLREALRFYAERENYTSGTHAFPDGSTVALYSPIENDSGFKARAALARLGGGAGSEKIKTMAGKWRKYVDTHTLTAAAADARMRGWTAEQWVDAYVDQQERVRLCCGQPWRMAENQRGMRETVRSTMLDCLRSHMGQRKVQ